MDSKQETWKSVHRKQTAMARVNCIKEILSSHMRAFDNPHTKLIMRDSNNRDEEQRAWSADLLTRHHPHQNNTQTKMIMRDSNNRDEEQWVQGMQTS